MTTFTINIIYFDLDCFLIMYKVHVLSCDNVCLVTVLIDNKTLTPWFHLHDSWPLARNAFVHLNADTGLACFLEFLIKTERLYFSHYSILQLAARATDPFSGRAVPSSCWGSERDHREWWSWGMCYWGEKKMYTKQAKHTFIPVWMNSSLLIWFKGVLQG